MHSGARAHGLRLARFLGQEHAPASSKPHLTQVQSPTARIRTPHMRFTWWIHHLEVRCRRQFRYGMRRLS